MMEDKSKKWIFELLNKETKGLNMKFRNAKSQLIFSYNDVVEILEKYNQKNIDDTKNEGDENESK